MTDKCELLGCGHALSMHNSLGYCRSNTTPDRTGQCACDSTRTSERGPRDNTDTPVSSDAAVCRGWIGCGGCDVTLMKGET